MATESLEVQLRPLLEPDELLLGTVVGVRGSRPGLEALAAGPLGVLVAVLGGSVAVSAGVAMLVGCAMMVARPRVCLAVTDQDLVMFGLRRLGSPRLTIGPSRYAHPPMPPSAASIGDLVLHVRRRRVWLDGVHYDEVRRLLRNARHSQRDL